MAACDGLNHHIITQGGIPDRFRPGAGFAGFINYWPHLPPGSHANYTLQQPYYLIGRRSDEMGKIKNPETKDIDRTAESSLSAGQDYV